ncbi:hypothetical protein MNV49_006039 [Pseudohyphozyma bogoriensis]|nr:hypothetical protein MNV49_006039 [Pseudohyphozyma bogoriensis]
MILRQYTAPPAALPSTSTAATPALPGLVSALRPISRVSSQLSTEALLLRRFTYKNKNQFKGCGWWRKIVHADRIASRVGAELEGLLGEFGLGKDKDDKELRITSEAMVRGLQRLPRSILLLEQTLAVLLNTASILNQLILTRAFLAFAVVVISLVARLHTLTTVLIDDIKNAARVMITLVEGNPDTFPPLKTLLAPLPETLRLVLVARDPLPSLSISLANDTSENNTASPSLPPSTTHSPSPFPYSIPSSVTIQKEDPTDFGTPIARDGGEGDEVGRRVSREELMEFVRSGSGAVT